MLYQFDFYFFSFFNYAEQGTTAIAVHRRDRHGACPKQRREEGRRKRGDVKTSASHKNTDERQNAHGGQGGDGHARVAGRKRGGSVSRHHLHREGEGQFDI